MTNMLPTLRTVSPNLRTTVIAAVLVLVVSPRPSLTDEFLLVHGGKIEGQLLNPDQSPRETYVLETTCGGRLVLSHEQVERVVRVSEMERRYEALLPTLPDTESGHWEMAERCRKADLEEQRLFHLEQVIRHNPDHEQARHGLGYSLVDGRWYRQEQWMEEQGYVRHRGSWRLPQEIAMQGVAEKHDQQVIAWRKKLKTWRSWIIRRRENQAAGEAEIRAIRDPLAAPGLAALLDDEKEHSTLKLLYIDVLGELPGPVPIESLTKHAIHNADAKIREACLDQLERSRPPSTIAAFVDALQHETNYVVNRAAIGLARLKASSATLPLIDALITEHKQVVNRGGGVRPYFSNQGGGLSVGGKQEIKKVKQTNEPVLHALTALHTGTNFGYNQGAWKNWYISQHTPPPVNLRRSE